MSFAERLEIPLRPAARGLLAVAVGLLAGLGLALVAVDAGGLRGLARVAAFLAVSAAFWFCWFRARHAAALGFGPRAVCGLGAPDAETARVGPGDGWDVWLADAPPAPSRRTRHQPGDRPGRAPAFVRRRARLLASSVWLPGLLVLHFADRETGRRYSRWLLGDEMPEDLWRSLKARVRVD